MLPVVVIIFNRPQHTANVLDSLRIARPERLFAIADGPRKDNPADMELCAKARELIQGVDWPCIVEKNYSAENLGLRSRVITGLDWVFQQVEEAVILEDDCVPSEDFFGFCAELLERHRHNPRVWAVSGDNFQGGQVRGNASYYYSKYFHCWGWATWRRVWSQFRPEIEFWHEFRYSPQWKLLHKSIEEQEHWEWIYDMVRSGNINSWAFPFMLNMWRAEGLCVLPQVNLVTNRGFDGSGTNCMGPSPARDLRRKQLGALLHPDRVSMIPEADSYTFDTLYRRARPTSATKSSGRWCLKAIKANLKNMYSKRIEGFFPKSTP
jgi:hypothetical protein